MSEQWWEIKVNHLPELEETISWRLQEFGCRGTAVLKEDDKWCIKGYVPSLTIAPLDLSALTLWLQQDFTLAGMDLPQVSWRLINNEDWSSSWKKHWQPMEIGERFLVYPAWFEPEARGARLIIRLDPGSAFGTGVHATTQLCLESLEMRFDDNENPDITIADIGCGSGILSIGARLLGSKKVIATDIDALAVKATKENSALNHIDDITVFQGSLEEVKEKYGQIFDGVVCNILAEVIKNLIPDFASIVKEGGWIALSGILVEQSSEISDLLVEYGWTVATVWKKDNWCCINARRLPSNMRGM